MTTTDISSSPALLTQEQRRVAERLVYGASNQLIARQVNLAVHTVASHLAASRRRLDRSGSSRAVLAHALLTAREVPPPSPTGPAPEFTEHDRQVIRAIAEHSRNAAIGEAIGVRADDVRAEIDAVVAKAGASNEVHLVGLGHAWNILRGDGAVAERTTAEPAGVVR
ncbi:helix-turn-helix transcriptional regulator [Streptomyces sp. RM72]|uniref:LuxR C-terminal-related transcriptional regulator n=1 Tax=Streptomyces TaxID=1883 RepID=UPI001B39523B|nr:helix-turn-helix transcriptional regulator [Streptomyces sp. RM72]MBQ0888684.1 helix-turn-helix transcriptional regulator [Streptomyces sp. RM72]